MILIADAGGTSVKWREVRKDGTIRQALTAGFNAYAHSKEILRKSLEELKGQIDFTEIEKVFFYGAGIASREKATMVERTLGTFLSTDQVEINSDLLGCARSLLGDRTGIVCILGTGSNSAFYDGKAIRQNIPSLGYILGDEGSGNALGKALLRAFFRKQLPEQIASLFQQRYQLYYGDLLEEIYTNNAGPAFLADFSRFLAGHQKDPYIYRLIYGEFTRFLEQVVAGYTESGKYPVCFSGSIAYYYDTILRKACADNGLSVGLIVEDPVAGLALYHQKNDL